LAGHFGSGETRFAVVSFQQETAAVQLPGVTRKTGENRIRRSRLPAASSGISNTGLIVGKVGVLKMRSFRFNTYMWDRENQPGLPG
jgi:hypothetical protein